MFDFVTAHWADTLAIYGAVVALATVIVKLTPTAKDDEILAKIVAVVDLFSTAHTAKDAAVLEAAKK